MQIIKKLKWLELMGMSQKWKNFKARRNQKFFDNEQASGFITMKQREEMLDSIFEILNYGTEEF